MHVRGLSRAESQQVLRSAALDLRGLAPRSLEARARTRASAPAGPPGGAAAPALPIAQPEGAKATSFESLLAARLPAAPTPARLPASPRPAPTATRPVPARPDSARPNLARAGAPARPAEERYVVQPGDTIWRLAVKRFAVDPGQLAADNGIEDPRRLAVGTELRVRRTVDTEARGIVASWYGPGFDDRPMANGAPYDRHAATIAHKTLPLGTEVEITNPRNGVTVRAQVTDRGPYVEGRDVDLSYGLARELGVVEAGVASLVMRVRG